MLYVPSSFPLWIGLHTAVLMSYLGSETGKPGSVGVYAWSVCSPLPPAFPALRKAERKSKLTNKCEEVSFHQDPESHDSLNSLASWKHPARGSHKILVFAFLEVGIPNT